MHGTRLRGPVSQPDCALRTHGREPHAGRTAPHSNAFPGARRPLEDVMPGSARSRADVRHGANLHCSHAALPVNSGRTTAWMRPGSAGTAGEPGPGFEPGLRMARPQRKRSPYPNAMQAHPERRPAPTRIADCAVRRPWAVKDPACARTEAHCPPGPGAPWACQGIRPCHLRTHPVLGPDAAGARHTARPPANSQQGRSALRRLDGSSAPSVRPSRDARYDPADLTGGRSAPPQ